MANVSPALERDAVVIGSGFGGSVAALRLAEKGYSVAVLEQGRRIGPPEMAQADQSLRHFFWAPTLKADGYFTQHLFRHLAVIGGVGVGGGSLVYAAVLLKPKPAFFRDPAWSHLGVDWQTELDPHYASAERMLGRTVSPRLGRQDELLRATAERMGAGHTWGPTPMGIYFGEPGQTRPDPFFGGKGPARTGCVNCARCATGCPHDAKNSLDKNYLFLAERAGAQIHARCQVRAITPVAGGYEVVAVDPFTGQARLRIKAAKVFVAAGVLGTVRLLFRCRDELQTLPSISRHLGQHVRTNSESLVGIVARDQDVDLTDGPTISSDFYPNPHTHITQNRFSPVHHFVRWQTGPLVDGPGRLWRALKTIALFFLRPLHATYSMRARRWTKRATLLTVMQHVDNELNLTYARGMTSWFRRRLQSQLIAGKPAPSYIPEANEAARLFASEVRGVPFNLLPESVAGVAATAHILGGCVMGAGSATGVIGTDHQVHGYPGLFVVDGAAVSANVGVNPSLTITALAERCMSLIPKKS